MLVVLVQSPAAQIAAAASWQRGHEHRDTDLGASGKAVRRAASAALRAAAGLESNGASIDTSGERTDVAERWCGIDWGWQATPRTGRGVGLGGTRVR